MCNHLLDLRKYWLLEQARRPQLTWVLCVSSVYREQSGRNPTANIQGKVIAFAITFTYRNTGRCLILTPFSVTDTIAPFSKSSLQTCNTLTSSRARSSPSQAFDPNANYRWLPNSGQCQ